MIRLELSHALLGRYEVRCRDIQWLLEGLPFAPRRCNCRLYRFAEEEGIAPRLSDITRDEDRLDIR